MNQTSRRIEKRRRSEVFKLRVLPHEAERLRAAVAQSGSPTIQAYLLAKLPEIAGPRVPGSVAGMA